MRMSLKTHTLWGIITVLCGAVGYLASGDIAKVALAVTIGSAVFWVTIGLFWD